jgi:membrane fusion protein (multidrug efflux system)
MPRWTGWAVFVVLVVGAAAWFGQAWLKPPIVEIVTPLRGTAASVVYASGTIEPVYWAKVSPLVRERIVSICNCEGETVSRGDRLAELDTSQLRARMAEAKARTDLARQELERATNLLARGTASRRTFERASADLSTAEAVMASLRAEQSRYQLRAPMDGVVLRRDAEVGEIADPGTILFWVGKPKPLQVIAEINEEDIPSVQPGQPVLLSADAFPDTPLEARVDRITPKGDPVLKTYRTYLALPDDTPLLVGMTVEVNIVTETRENALLVPASAVRDGRVFALADDGVVQSADVETGIVGATAIEVLSGIDDDARILRSPPDDINTGQRITPVTVETWQP